MSKMWVFGDSYGVHLASDPKKTTPWFWTYSLGKRLGCTEYKNFSQWGAGNDYIHHCVDLHSKEISSEDYVIIISSSISREWLIEDKPYLSNYYANDLHNFISRDQYNSIAMYVNNLQFERKTELNFKKMLESIHYKTLKYNWKCIVIPGFEHDGFPVSENYSVKGSLFDVCYNEFKTIEDREWFYNTFSNTIDKRAGHIIKNNHTILENKLYNTFTKNNILDLTTDFESFVISKNNTDFLIDQLNEFEMTANNVSSSTVPSY
jgi:hypothetical protein